MSTIMAFGLASTMLLVGVILRSKVRFLRNYLVPSSVIAGILGLIIMNSGIELGVDANTFTTIVNHVFTLSFISIALTSAPKQDKNSKTGKTIFKGAWGMGNIWNFLYAFTPLVGVIIVLLMGKFSNMHPIYAMLIQFGFAQGPGQAAAYGTILEQFGWENAAVVGVTFAAMGFLISFVVGVPLAKYGIKRGFGKYTHREIDDSVKRGYYTAKEQTQTIGKVTTYSGNIETLSFHLALMGLCYIIAFLIARAFSLLPGFLGVSMSGMMFMNGMFAAYIVKFTMNKLGLSFLHDNMLQSKITSCTSDYLVVFAFMAVQIHLIRQWLLPIFVICIVISIVTLIVCIYFVPRIGGENGFERLLGLFGTGTGTIPSGIALVRIVDPSLMTTTATELGLMNLLMLLCTPVYLTVLAYASDTISLMAALAMFLGLSILYLVILALGRCWGKPAFSFHAKTMIGEKDAKTIL